MHEKHVWFRPRRSFNGPNCVETMITDEAVLVRNSRAPEAGTAVFTYSEWRAFIDSVRETDDYDIPA
ncbi:hypothetical protein GCM10012275_47420 [Longimycelium tulufanense]|uniref:DUF397 domain-containing protein n=1 Tax=Longimycelium tulufanense TaxID=907463 RepID=A0A8J3CBW2_9PSEU|nr:DUF397 domain-containing protein [Longimycelium tulufanense]GGM71475.1 hypothetical protein GCM10012275_47420 [Longimycelium tulufanense]